MLLTLWLLIAWVCATAAFIQERGGYTASVVFWLAITLAGLTKGPAVLVLIIYIILAARLIGGRWSAIRLLHPIAGGLFALLVCGAWIFAVWKIDPQHLKQELLANPFLELLEPEEEESLEQPTDQAKEKEQAQKDDEVDWEEILLNGFEVGGAREQYEQLEYTEPVTVETAR